LRVAAVGIVSFNFMKRLKSAGYRV